MKIYRVNFDDYSDEYFFAGKSLEDAKAKAEAWAKKQNQKFGEEYGKINCVDKELETEN